MTTIDPERVLADLRSLAQFGAYRSGVHRPTFSEADIAARRWFADRMRSAGLETRIDGIGNILGRSSASGPIMLAGSHLESVAFGGWLDGALGCVYAIEAARVVAAYEPSKGLGVDVLVMCDEEGHFGSFLGSRSAIGALNETHIDEAFERRTGRSLRHALRDAGLDGAPRFVIDPSRYVGFLEAHIEQGRVLERTKARIGIVSAIVGTRQYRIRARGEQNHAGTTSMADRRDAGLALVRLLNEIDAEFAQKSGTDTVWTTGRIELFPGARSVIPGSAEALFQFRDESSEVLSRLESVLGTIVDEFSHTRPCIVELEVLSRNEPTRLDAHLQTRIEEAARNQGVTHLRLCSGATHDTQYLAQILPAAMLFVPSIGGVSHHWNENTDPSDIVIGAQVFVDAIFGALDAASVIRRAISTSA